MNVETKRQSNPWTKGEKFLLGAILLTVAVAALGTFWWRQINTTPYVSVPTPTMPPQNAFDDFSVAASNEVQATSVSYAIQTTTPLPNQPPGSLDRIYSPQEKAALVQANASTLRMLRQGLTLPYQNPPIRSFSTLMPYYAKFRGLARLLYLEGQVRETRGDWAGAVNSHLDAVELGEKVPHGGALIGMLVGTACEAIGRRPFWDDVGHLNAAQARAAIHRLEVIQQAQVPLADTLQEEEWTIQASLMELFHHPTWRGDLLAELTAGGDSGSGLTPSQLTHLRFAGKKAILESYTAAIDASIRAARQPYTFPAPDAPSDPIVQEINGDFKTQRCRATDNKAQNALLLTTMALRAYRLEHGSYPATLASLAPAYLKEVPADPFAASGPLQYKRQGNQYVLYSVGPDGKNDGGKPIFDATKPAPQPGEHDQRNFVMPDSQGDIVAGVNF